MQFESVSKSVSRAGPRLIGGIVALLAGVLTAAPASAGDTEAGLEIGTGRYTVTMPAGYCSDTPVSVNYRADQMKRQGPAATPELALVPCDAKTMTFDLFAVKVMEWTALSRATTLASLRSAMPALTGDIPTDSANANLGRRLSEALNTDVSVNTQARLVDVDDTCAYIAAVITFAVQDRKMPITMMACMTVIGSNKVYLYRYLPGTDRARAEHATEELKQLVQSIRPRT